MSIIIKKKAEQSLLLDISPLSLGEISKEGQLYYILKK